MEKHKLSTKHTVNLNQSKLVAQVDCYSPRRVWETTKNINHSDFLNKR